MLCKLYSIISLLAMERHDVFFFFPVYGLQIEDTEPSHTFIFDNATIMSAWEVVEFGKGLEKEFLSAIRGKNSCAPKHKSNTPCSC